ncbi:hypothetical protein BDF14DRAFT_187987 [Spinellus fusiger]|nr:hypothetical protein BDF14DRAFT_187987 [Spinellus fusiger]
MDLVKRINRHPFSIGTLHFFFFFLSFFFFLFLFSLFFVCLLLSVHPTMEDDTEFNLTCFLMIEVELNEAHRQETQFVYLYGNPLANPGYLTSYKRVKEMIGKTFKLNHKNFSLKLMSHKKTGDLLIKSSKELERAIQDHFSMLDGSCMLKLGLMTGKDRRYSSHTKEETKKTAHDASASNKTVHNDSHTKTGADEENSAGDLWTSSENDRRRVDSLSELVYQLNDKVTVGNERIQVLSATVDQLHLRLEETAEEIKTKNHKLDSLSSNVTHLKHKLGKMKEEAKKKSNERVECLSNRVDYLAHVLEKDLSQRQKETALNSTVQRLATTLSEAVATLTKASPQTPRHSSVQEAASVQSHSTDPPSDHYHNVRSDLTKTVFCNACLVNITE